jgi:CBS domain-containing protein
VFVSDVMSAPAVTVTADTTIKAAARLLRDRDVAAAPVVDGAGQLVGIVSEIDLLRGSVTPDPVAHLVPVTPGAGAPPRTVEDVMTRDVQVLQPHSDLYDAARSMRSSGIRSLPVVDGGTVVGVVSRSDLLEVLARDDDEIARDLLTAVEAELGGQHGVAVVVDSGVVTLTGGRAGALAVASVLAARVPGVVRVQTPDAQTPELQAPDAQAPPEAGR